MEQDLLPTLRESGMIFVAYRVLSAGFMAGNFDAGAAREGTRFADSHPLGKAMQGLYGNPKSARAEVRLSAILETHGLPLVEASLRWVCYHAALGIEDGIILGGSRLHQFERNIAAIEKGHLTSGLANEMSQVYRQLNG